mgnify:CR=1 FL=1
MKVPTYIDENLRRRCRQASLDLERLGIKKKANVIAEEAIEKHVTALEKRLAS